MSTTPAASPPGPYRGLAVFGSDDLDALLFFGRERETEVIAANVLASRFTVLYGPLGVGKSSVLRAGVLRRVRALAPEAAAVVYDSWPGDPLDGLLQAAAAELGAEGLRGASLAEGLAELVALTGRELYLLLDQFEELFVYPGAEAVAAALAEVVTRRELPVDVLVALREDSLAELDVFTGRIPDVFGNSLRLDRLDREAARAAVVGPLARYGELAGRSPVEIEDELVEAVLDEVEAGRVTVDVLEGDAGRPESRGGIEAPYLQLVMEQLWEAEGRRGSRVLRRATLAELGGAEAIVRGHVDEAVGALSPGQRDVAARVFHHLVTPSGTKIAHGAGDLAGYAGVREEELRAVLVSLTASRIVRPVEGRFEIFHDVLAEAVLAWQARHESERALARQRAEADRRQRRLLALLVSSLVVLAALTVVAVYALTQRAEARDQAELARVEARRAQANRLAAEASLLLPVAQAELHPQLSLALAAEAVRLSPTPRAVDILRRSLLVSHLRAVLPETDATAAAFAPDGRRLAVGTARGLVRLYAPDGQEQLAELSAGGPVTGLSFSRDGSRLLATVDGGPATLWDAERDIAPLRLGTAAAAAAFSPDGSLVVTGGGREARVWSAENGSLVVSLPLPEPVRLVSFGSGGELVAVAGGSAARVFSTRTGRQIAEADHGKRISSALLVPGSRTLVTAGRDPVVRLWTLERGGRLLRELEGHGGAVEGAAVSGDGALLATAGADGTARVWELPSGRPVAQLLGHASRVTGAAFSADSSSLATWSAGGTALVADAGSLTARALLAGHGDAVASASFGPSGDVLLTLAADGRARLWRTRVDDDLRTVAVTAAPVEEAAFSADGSTVAVATASEVELRRAADGEVVARLSAEGVRALALSRDGGLVATAEGDLVSVRAAGENEPRRVLEAAAVTALAFDASGERLALGSEEGMVEVRALDAGRTLSFAGPAARVTAVALSPSADRVVAGYAEGTVVSWRLPEGSDRYRRREHQAGTPVTSVAFDGAGERFVTGGGDSTVRVWDAASGEERYVLRGHFGTVQSAAFDLRGEWIATAGRRLAGLWSTATRQRLLFARGEASDLLGAAIGPSGLSLAAVASDGTLGVYSCEVCVGAADLLALADERLAATGRVLTPAERAHYLGGD